MVFLVAAADSLADEPARRDSATMNYSWAGNKIEAELWGMAQGDIDGNGSAETVLLERKDVRIGRIGEKGFEGLFTCTWKADAAGVRVYLFDIDSDGKDEAVVSAVEAGMPSSLILKIDPAAKSCTEIVSRARWSLRVIDLPAEGGDSGATKRALVGQGSNSQKFYTGPVMELKLKEKKLVADRKIDIPRYTELYQFILLPSVEGASRAVRLAGPAAMELREQLGGKGWKRAWRSGERLGGTSNVIAAEQRPLLDEVSSEYAGFETPPIALARSDGTHLVVPKFDIPLRNAVGRKPYIRGSAMVVFKPDQVLGFVEERRSPDLPGAIVDYIMDRDHPGRLLVLLQEDAGAFENSQRSTIMGFDLEPLH